MNQRPAKRFACALVAGRRPPSTTLQGAQRRHFSHLHAGGPWLHKAGWGDRHMGGGIGHCVLLVGNHAELRVMTVRPSVRPGGWFGQGAGAGRPAEYCGAARGQRFRRPGEGVWHVDPTFGSLAITLWPSVHAASTDGLSGTAGERQSQEQARRGHPRAWASGSAAKAITHSGLSATSLPRCSRRRTEGGAAKARPGVGMGKWPCSQGNHIQWAQRHFAAQMPSPSH